MKPNYDRNLYRLRVVRDSDNEGWYIHMLSKMHKNDFGSDLDVAHLHVPDDNISTTHYRADDLHVSPEFRRQGLARAMYQAATNKFGIPARPPSIQEEMGKLMWSGNELKPPSVLHNQPPVLTNREGLKPSNFDRWFEGSKVVGPDGKPKIVYHGTKSSFSEFGNESDWESSLGFHFGPLHQAQKRLSQTKSEGGQEGINQMPVYLSLKNPLRTVDAGTWQNPYSAWTSIQKGLGVKKPDPVDFFSAYGSPPQDHDLASQWRSTTRRMLMADLMEKGFDGIVYKNCIEGKGDAYIAFQPGQIKSALGNSGAYDPQNPDITDRPQPEKLASKSTASSDAKTSLTTIDQAHKALAYLGELSLEAKKLAV